MELVQDQDQAAPRPGGELEQLGLSRARVQTRERSLGDGLVENLCVATIRCGQRESQRVLATEVSR